MKHTNCIVAWDRLFTEYYTINCLNMFIHVDYKTDLRLSNNFITNRTGVINACNCLKYCTSLYNYCNTIQAYNVLHVYIISKQHKQLYVISSTVTTNSTTPVKMLTHLTPSLFCLYAAQYIM